MDRAYHVFLEFEGDGYSDKVRAYLDGVLQADSAGDVPGYTTLTARSSIANWSDPAGTVGLDGTALTTVGAVNIKFNHWAAWAEGNAPLTSTEVREELFEKGALPDVTISTATEATMQTALDAYADIVRGDAPLCIRVEPVLGGGDLDLSADNITFSPLASIHVQYTGTDELTWTNTNGANASIGSSSNGGTISFVNPATLTIDGLINGCEVRVYDTNNTELDGTETLSDTSFDYSHSGASVTVIVQMIATGYEEVWQSVFIGGSDQTLLLFPTAEKNI